MLRQATLPWSQRTHGQRQWETRFQDISSLRPLETRLIVVVLECLTQTQSQLFVVSFLIFVLLATNGCEYRIAAA